MPNVDEFLKSEINTEVFGLYRAGAYDEPYYCTPKDARILFTVGVDGIHFCTVPDFNEMIFAVSPMNFGDCVHPIARNFDDFLALLLYCKDISPLEQCFCFDKEQFEAFVSDIKPQEEHENVKREIEEKFGICANDNAFEYVKKLQCEFDLSKIRYSDEYYETVTDDYKHFPVYYDKQENGECVCEEIRIDCTFSKDDKIWTVPSVYTCKKGIVIDFCIETETEDFEAFAKTLVNYNQQSEIAKTDVEAMIRNNPLNVCFAPELNLNGKIYPRNKEERFYYVPRLLQNRYSETCDGDEVIDYYGLNGEKCYTVCRFYFDIAVSFGDIKSLSVIIKALPQEFDGIHFCNPKVDDVISFVHPVFNTEHKLTVVQYNKNQTLPPVIVEKPYVLPSVYTEMKYTITPDIPREKFRVSDCADSDTAVIKDGSENSSDCFASAIGIIGGADGPTSVFVAKANDENCHCVMSSLHHTAVENIEWHIEFFEKISSDCVVKLI